MILVESIIHRPHRHKEPRKITSNFVGCIEFQFKLSFIRKQRIQLAKSQTISFISHFYWSFVLATMTINILIVKIKILKRIFYAFLCANIILCNPRFSINISQTHHTHTPSFCVCYKTKFIRYKMPTNNDIFQAKAYLYNLPITYQ